MDAKQRGQARAWAGKAHVYATWIEWTVTLVATVGGLVAAAAIVMVRASSRAAGMTEANVFLDLGVPGAIVLGAGVAGYLAGLVASSAFRFMGHMVRVSASIDERLEGGRGR